MFAPTIGIVSITIALLPAKLFEPVGAEVSDSVFPNLSTTALALPLASTSAKELTFKSAELKPAPTVYTPVIVVPLEAAVSVTVSEVSKVTVIVESFRTSSEVLAVMLISTPAL